MNQASLDERKKAKREEERQQKLEAKQKQEENEIEKRENAEAAFKAWKEHKNNIEKERRGRLYRFFDFIANLIKKDGYLLICAIEFLYFTLQRERNKMQMRLKTKKLTKIWMQSWRQQVKRTKNGCHLLNSVKKMKGEYNF